MGYWVLYVFPEGAPFLIKKAQFIKVSQIHLIVTTEGAGGGTCPIWERQAVRLLLAPTCKINYAWWICSVLYSQHAGFLITSTAQQIYPHYVQEICIVLAQGHCVALTPLLP